MRIKVSVNAEEKYTASLSGSGYLGAHLNLSNRPKQGKKERKIQVMGHDTSSDNETISLSWPEIKLNTGDSVEIKLLEDGEGNAPVTKRSTSEHSSNLFSNAKLAEEALLAGRKFESEILEILKKATSIESDEETNKIRRSIGHLLAALGDHLYSPIWRRHPELIPDALKGELL